MSELRPWTMRYRVVHTTNYSYSEPVALCHSEVYLTPRKTARQTCVAHALEIVPASPKIEACLDYFGNSVNFFTIQQRHLAFSVTALSDVELVSAVYIPPESTPPWEAVRDALRAPAVDEAWDASQFVYNSPLVAASAELAGYAARSFSPGRPWLEAVLDLTARIYGEFVYDPAATNIGTPLATVLKTRRGVCQDFAHLQIGCLRAMGLAARYVSGYLSTMPLPGETQLVGAHASHAWLTAWCPGPGWVDLDPTNNIVPSLDHITVALGRDYADVCPIKGVFVGGGQHELSVSVDVQAIATNGAALPAHEPCA